MADPARLCVGVIAGRHGVRGAVKIKTFTDRPEGIAALSGVVDEAGDPVALEIVEVRKSVVIARLAGVTDADAISEVIDNADKGRYELHTDDGIASTADYGREGATVIVEAGLPWGLLFLFNNLHVVHHAKPGLAWYRLPALYRSERERFLTLNGGYFFKGYREVFRRYFLRVKEQPLHPAERRPSRPDTGMVLEGAD